MNKLVYGYDVLDKMKHDHNCDFVDNEYRERVNKLGYNADEISFDVQYYMFSKGYCLTNETCNWVKISSIKDYDDKWSNGEYLDSVDTSHLHHSGGCLKNMKKYDPTGYKDHLKWVKEGGGDSITWDTGDELVTRNCITGKTKRKKK